MKYYIQGKGKVDLTQNDFIFKGGEGIVYGKGDMAYKIYNDRSKLIPDAKIRELSILKRPEIIKPIDMVLDKKNSAVGFSMNWIKDSIPLAKLFTSGFKKRNSITDANVLEIVETIKEVTVSIHKAGCLIVDGNEFNYLVDNLSYTTPYFIDVNSYQTPSFPATAIMPSIRDWHSRSFSELTDWFSFAIVAFQLFIGVHPYKGRHPAYTRKTMGSHMLVNRMKDNVSVFNKNVSIPPSARNVDSIPHNYIDWFKNLFEHGARIPPPSAPGSVLTAKTGKRIIQSHDNLDIRLIREYKSEILSHQIIFGREIIKTENSLYMDNRKIDAANDERLVFSPRSLIPILVRVADNTAGFRLLKPETIRASFPVLECSEAMAVGNTQYFKNRGNLVELQIGDMPNRLVGMVKSTWNILPNSSQLFEGIIYQNVLDTPYLTIPLPRFDGPSSCLNIHIPELKGYRVLNARHENRICMIIAHKDDKYSRMIFKFDHSYDHYDCRIMEDIDYTGINFTVLDNGIVIAINDEGSIEIFSHEYGMDRMDILKDPCIETPMQLCKDGIAARFFRSKQLFSIRMKNR